MTYSKLLQIHHLIDVDFLHSNPEGNDEVIQVPLVRIGPDYQVVIPELRDHEPLEGDYEDNSVLIWQPDPGRITDQELSEYLNVADVLGYETFHALAILYRFDYGLGGALQELIRGSEHRHMASIVCNRFNAPDIPTGPEHQVAVPEFIGDHPPPEDYPEDSSLVWKPDSGKIDDQTLVSYLEEASRNRCDQLQALKVLYRCGYNTTEALAEIRPLPLTYHNDYPVKQQQIGIDVGKSTRSEENTNETIELWKPDPSRIDDQSLEIYLKETSQIGYGSLEALSMLYRCEYNASAALALISQFVVTT